MTRAPAWLMRRFWDAHSHGWDQVASGNEATGRRQRLVGAVSSLVPDGGRVVDLGCGAGQLATELALRGYSVTAADFSAGMLDLARRRASDAGLNVTFARVDLDGPFPWPPESFDAAVSVYVVQMVHDPLAFLTRTVGVVAPGGALVVDAPSGASQRSSLPEMAPRDRLLNEVKRAAARLPGGKPWLSAEALRRTAESAGLTVTSLSTVGPASRLVARTGPVQR